MAKLGKLLFSNKALKTEAGLTIIETIVAIAVFSFLIVLCIGLFIFLGRIYYRGLYENRVQEVARTIVDSVAESIRTSGAEVDPNYTPTSEIVMIAGTPYTHTWYAYCIGNIQYSYKLNTQLVAEPDGPNEAEEVFVAVRGCDKTADANPDTVPADKTELLSEGMRLLEFSVNPVGDNQDFYRIRIKVAVGGDASDLPYDKSVFEYAYHPCSDYSSTMPVLTSESPAPLTETDCRDGLDDADSTMDDLSGLNWWKDPEETTANPIHTESAPAGVWETLGPPNAIIHQCQDSESFCSVIEIETKVFRRIL